MVKRKSFLKAAREKKTCYIHRNKDNNSIVLTGNNARKKIMEQKEKKSTEKKPL